MNKRKIFLLIPITGLFLTGCTLQDGWNWVNSNIFSPIGTFFSNLFGPHNEAKPKEKSDDQKVYEDMTNDHTSIFQFESQFAGDCLSKMHCTSVFDMSLVNACIRPSGESYRDKLLQKIPNRNPSKIIDELLKNNYGWLVYQEDTIAFLQQICGFSGSDADQVRRAIGRKKVDELNKALPKILDGYCSKSDKPREIAEEEARAFLKVIEDLKKLLFM